MPRPPRRPGGSATEGVVRSYIHAGGKIGVLVEINCETDFVAKTDEFQALVKDMAMHIAAVGPAGRPPRRDHPPTWSTRSGGSTASQARESGKPENILEKIVEGKVDKFFKDVCLLEQPFVKDTDKSVEQVVKEAIAVIGENISVRRFTRYVLGEGLEKKEEDFAAEVAKAAAGG